MPIKPSSGARRRWPWPSRAEIPPSLAHAQFFGAVLSQYRRDAAETYARADALTAFATTQGLVHHAAYGRILLGWALARQGDATTGVAHIHQGLEAIQRTGLKLYRPYFLALLAEASGQAGQPEAGLTVLAEALTLVAATEERWWEAEVYRLQGALLLQLPSPDVGQAEACFQQALDVARRQQAKALELRAALSLSRLWQEQGKRPRPPGSCWRRSMAGSRRALTRLTSRRPENVSFPLCILEQLHTVVAPVGHIDVAVHIHGHARRPVELVHCRCQEALVSLLHTSLVALRHPVRRRVSRCPASARRRHRSSPWQMRSQKCCAALTARALPG